jgi:hypothetical protein
MAISIAFWIVMLLILIFCVIMPIAKAGWRPHIGWVLLFCAVALIGWQLFGPPIK